MDKKKKQIITGCAVGGLLVAGGVVYFMSQSNKDYLVLKKDVQKTVEIEYGKAVDINLDTYLDLSNLTKEEKSDVKKNAKISVLTDKNKKATNEKDKEYLSVGKYNVSIEYKDEKETVKIDVKDTTAPVINGVESIEMVQGTDINSYDFGSLFSIEDLADVGTKFDTKNVDTSKVGEYTLKITSTDESKNKTEKSVKITVVPAPSAEQEAVTEKVTNSDGTVSVKTVTKPKQSATTSTTTSAASGSSSSTSSTKPSSGSASTSKPSGSSSSSSSTKPSSGGGSSSSGSSGSGSGSGGSSSTPTPQPTKYTLYWYKCNVCGKYVESRVSIDDAKNKLNDSSCPKSSLGEHYNRNYGIRELFE